MRLPGDGENRSQKQPSASGEDQATDRASGRSSCRGAWLWRHGSLSSKQSSVKELCRVTTTNFDATSPGIQGFAFARLGLGRSLAITPVAGATPLDGRVAPRLQMLAARHC